MKTCTIPRTDLVVSRLGYGWVRLGGGWDRDALTADTVEKAARAIQTAYDNGITLFDLADVYAFGKSETAFGKVLRKSSGLRDKIVIQSKCGIHISTPMSAPSAGDPHHFDLSYEHIVRSVEGSLRRLDTDHLDILLLHRPDALVEPEEVARAFDELHQSGKVRYFGVSNHTASQIALLQKHARQPLVINQVEVGLAHPQLITDGIDANRLREKRLTQPYSGVAGLLDYCRFHDIQVQAYSPVRGLFGSVPDALATIEELMQLLRQLAQKKNSTSVALALAWLLRHPAGIVPIIGAADPKHISENCAADRVSLGRQEWYALLYAATGMSPVRML